MSIQKSVKRKEETEGSHTRLEHGSKLKHTHTHINKGKRNETFLGQTNFIVCKDKGDTPLSGNETKDKHDQDRKVWYSFKHRF